MSPQCWPECGIVASAAADGREVQIGGYGDSECRRGVIGEKKVRWEYGKRVLKSTAGLWTVSGWRLDVIRQVAVLVNRGMSADGLDSSHFR